jgi:hypothetical protein
MKTLTTEDLNNFEIMDRTWMVMEHLSHAVLEHPKLDKTNKKRLNKAYQLLFDVYQDAGSKLP